jgi:hypothetical protein
MKAMIIGLLLVAGLQAQTLVAKDSNGLVVEIKEKYGGWRVDTVTVVMLYKGNFVLVRRDGSTSWLPASFNSINIVKSLRPRDQRAMMPVSNCVDPVRSRRGAGGSRKVTGYG